MILYYCCTQNNNNCPNKESCMRYLHADSEPHAKLFKYACTEDNNYQLYIAKEITTELVAKNDGDENAKG